MAWASRFWLMRISFRNSSFRISPGCGLRSCPMATSFDRLQPSMIINDLDIVSVVIEPTETDAPPVVDPDAQLPGARALSPSSRFPGGFLRSSTVRDASSWRSFRKARSWMSAGSRRLARPCQTRSVSLLTNDTIIHAAKYVLVRITYQGLTWRRPSGTPVSRGETVEQAVSQDFDRARARARASPTPGARATAISTPSPTALPIPLANPWVSPARAGPKRGLSLALANDTL